VYLCVVGCEYLNVCLGGFLSLPTHHHVYLLIHIHGERAGVVRNSFSFDYYSISHVEAENYRLMCLCLISSGARFVVMLKLAVRIDKIMWS